MDAEERYESLLNEQAKTLKFIETLLRQIERLLHSVGLCKPPEELMCVCGCHNLNCPNADPESR